MLEANSGTAVCLYSTGGSINLSTSNLTINGILYAPNGAVNISASNIYNLWQSDRQEYIDHGKQRQNRFGGKRPRLSFPPVQLHWLNS